MWFACSDGVLVVDNALWKGKVTDPGLVTTDKYTQVLHSFNNHVAEDTRTSQMMLPVRDGLLLVRHNNKA